MGPAEAIGAPRIHCEGTVVEVDTRLPDTSIDGLRARGHELVMREETPVTSNFSRPNGIMVDPSTGVLRGGVMPFTATVVPGAIQVMLPGR
jgi:gamma-glutamyltranspeptidase